MKQVLRKRRGFGLKGWGNDMFTERLNDLKKILDQTEFDLAQQKLEKDFAYQKIHEMLRKVKEQHGKVYVIGNGGSAGIASHHANDLMNVVKVGAIVLTDNNLLTCMANDFGYEQVYARPLQTLLESKDLLVAISSSGKSQNIVTACKVAGEKQAGVITLSGFKSENPLRKLGNINIWCGVEDYGLVESAHFFLLHTVIDSWR